MKINQRHVLYFFTLAGIILLVIFISKTFVASGDTSVVVDFTNSTTLKDSANTTGIWNSNVLGGAHARSQWVNMGGGATSTSGLTVVTSTKYISGKGYTVQTDQQGTNEFVIAWSDTPTNVTSTFNITRWNDTTNTFTGYDVNDATEVIVSTHTGSTYLGSSGFRLDRNGNPSLTFLNNNNCQNYFIRWDSNAGQWEGLDDSASPGRILAFDTKCRYTQGLWFDESNNPIVSYNWNKAFSKQETHVAKWNGSSFVGFQNGNSPDNLTELFTSTTTDNVNAISIIDSNNRPYVWWGYDSDGTGNKYHTYFSYFNGTEWVKPSNGASGANIIISDGYYSYPRSGNSNGGLFLVGNKIYYNGFYTPSSGDAYNSFISIFNSTNSSWTALDGTDGVTSTNNFIKSVSSTNNYFIEAMNVTSDGRVYVVFKDDQTGSYRLYVRQWDPTALAWRSIENEINSTDEDILTVLGGTMPNYTAASMLLDAQSRPVIAMRRIDPNDSSRDQIVMARLRYVTSTPSVIQTLNIAPGSYDEYESATLQANADGNGGAISYQLSHDGGSTWVSAGSNGVFTFPAPTNSVRLRAQMTPVSTGAATPVLRSVTVNLVARQRSAYVTGSAPTQPIIEGVDVLGASSVRYRFHAGSTNTTGFKLIEQNQDGTSRTILSSDSIDQGTLTSYTENGLDGFVTYCNRALVAFNGNGESSSASFPCFSMTVAGASTTHTDSSTTSGAGTISTNITTKTLTTPTETTEITEENVIPYNPVTVKESVPTIDIEKELVGADEASQACSPGTAVKSETDSAVYYCGSDGNRYLFQNNTVYNTWFASFDTMVTVLESELSTVPLAGVVTYRPGVLMIKTPDDPKVYAIAPHGVIRWITNEDVAATLYGENWNTKIVDVSTDELERYMVGEGITINDVQTEID